MSPLITGIKRGHAPNRSTAVSWAFTLAFLPALITWGMTSLPELYTSTVLISGLLLFGAIFAVNSAVHSFLILDFAKHDGVSLDVGFYYMANAMGRLIGTILSGVMYQQFGLISCLIVSSVFILLAGLISLQLPKTH